MRSSKLPRHQSNPTRHLGVSIIEVMISATILGIVGVVTLQGVAAMHRSHLDTVDAARADLLARDLMDEILLHDFQSAASQTDNATREFFQSIADYDGWNADGSLPPQSKTGQPLNIGSGWARRATVKNVHERNITAVVVTNSTRLKQITVTVSRFSKDLKSISTIRSANWKSAQTLD